MWERVSNRCIQTHRYYDVNEPGLGRIDISPSTNQVWGEDDP